MRFTRETKTALGYYVYGLVDPKNGEIFYVGKASGNDRAFDHLRGLKQETAKQRRIAEIRATGAAPQVEVLRHGIETEHSAFEVEASIIDALGVENLTNMVRGHGVERGRFHATDAERRFGATPISVADVDSNCILFFIHNTYSPTFTELEIYDCTRGFWHSVSKATRERQNMIALAVVESVVVRAYSIVAWFAAGSTLSSRPFQYGNPERKYEFVGQLVSTNQVVGRSILDIDGNPIKATQNGYRYAERA